jgi:hypothetical protein
MSAAGFVKKKVGMSGTGRSLKKFVASWRENGVFYGFEVWKEGLGEIGCSKPRQNLLKL